MKKLFPKKILIGIQEGKCNLKCPKCYTHGANSPSENIRPVEVMEMDLFKKILDESKEFTPRIAPQTWDEPLLNKDIFLYLEEIKKRELVVTMDTNGLLLNSDAMKILVDLKIDSVFISIDAMTKETLLKTRGISSIEMLKDRVLAFLKARGAKVFPRIGVSFVEEEANVHEREEFAKFWIEHVDVVRINSIFGRERGTSSLPSSNRTPCWSLWDSLMIHPSGEVALCCVDTHYQTSIGSLANSTIKEIWNGTVFEQIRRGHEQGVFGNDSICKKCTLWSNDTPLVSRSDNVLISKTNTHTYYNRIDKIGSLPSTNRYLKV